MPLNITTYLLSSEEHNYLGDGQSRAAALPPHRKDPVELVLLPNYDASFQVGCSGHVQLGGNPGTDPGYAREITPSPDWGDCGQGGMGIFN